jgi:hypothetical protein
MFQIYRSAIRLLGVFLGIFFILATNTGSASAWFDLGDDDGWTDYYETSCFLSGTKVNTDKGMVNIEDVKSGDKVLSEDEGGTRSISEVVELKTPKKGQVCKISFEGGGELRTILSLWLVWVGRQSIRVFGVDKGLG